MAKRYRPVDRDQRFLLPPDMRDWLPAGSPGVAGDPGGGGASGYLRVPRRAQTGGPGTAGYDPDMLVTVLVWAYAHRVTSSRRIEAAVRHRCGVQGDLRRERPRACDDLGVPGGFPGWSRSSSPGCWRCAPGWAWGSRAMVALVGMKIAASAPESANRTEETLREAGRRDRRQRARRRRAAEDDLFGAGAAGDEVPGEHGHAADRVERIAAALASLRAGRAAEQEREKREEEVPGGGGVRDARRGIRRPGRRRGWPG